MALVDMKCFIFANPSIFNLKYYSELRLKAGGNINKETQEELFQLKGSEHVEYIIKGKAEAGKCR